MEKPIINYQSVLPLFVQTYERYLPTAFDESLSLVQKVNKIIIHLNQIGELANSVLEQWNQVMEWVLADGLDASVDAKLDAMMADGTLDDIINHNIFEDLNTLITNQQTALTALTQTVADNKTSLETSLTTKINDNKTDADTKLAKKAFKTYGSPEEYGAKGDGVTDDTLALQQCLNENSVTVLTANTYRITTTLKLPKNHSIDGNSGRIIVNGGWVNNTLGVSVPNNCMIWVEGREPIYQSDLEMKTSFQSTRRLYGND
jgi:hypothetical protein